MDNKKRLSDDIAEVLLSQIVVEKKNTYQEINFPMKSIYRKN